MKGNIIPILITQGPGYGSSCMLYLRGSAAERSYDDTEYGVPAIKVPGTCIFCMCLLRVVLSAPPSPRQQSATKQSQLFRVDNEAFLGAIKASSQCWHAFPGQSPGGRYLMRMARRKRAPIQFPPLCQFARSPDSRVAFRLHLDAALWSSPRRANVVLSNCVHSILILCGPWPLMHVR